MTKETQAPRQGRELTVDSDWITTFGAVALFIICLLLLAGDTRKFISGHLKEPMHLQKSFWSIWNKVFETVAAIYGFALASSFTQKPVKIACLLMAVKLAGFVLLSFFNLSLSVRHIAALTGSVVSQTALVIFCVAIVQWLKRVVRWNTAPEPHGGNS
jgi:hypothetical protein